MNRFFIWIPVRLNEEGLAFLTKKRHIRQKKMKVIQDAERI
ncbi:hypothetical protein BACPU_01080 [Bacillus pumilus]|nr:hypothetical protein BACPU_01080 [Bacillus pumilus]